MHYLKINEIALNRNNRLLIWIPLYFSFHSFNLFILLFIQSIIYTYSNLMCWNKRGFFHKFTLNVHQLNCVMYKHMKCYVLNNKQSSVYNRHKRRQLSTFLMVFFSGNRLLHLFEYIGWYKLVRFSIKMKSFSMANLHQHTRLFILPSIEMREFCCYYFGAKVIQFF